MNENDDVVRRTFDSALASLRQAMVSGDDARIEAARDAFRRAAMAQRRQMAENGARSSDRIILPVGIPMGTQFNEGVDVADDGSEVAEVMLGAGYFRFPMTSFLVWSGLRVQHDVPQLVSLLENAGINDAGQIAEIVDELLENGLAIDCGSDTAIREIFGSHRLVANGLAVGNSPERLSEFIIRTTGDGELRCGPVTFVAWAASHSCRSLIDACQFVVDQSDGDVSIESVVGTLRGDLPRIVESHAGFLDRI